MNLPADGSAARSSVAALAISIVLTFGALASFACGGDDDDDSGGDPSGGEATTTATSGESTSPAGSTDVPDGAPEPEDADFPDVYADLEPGSSAETETGEDLEQKPGRVRVTIAEILDPAEPEPIYQAASGTRLWAVRIRMESLGEGTIPVSEFHIRSNDGNDVESTPGATADSLVLFGELAQGESIEGVVVFELPGDAVVEYLYIDPSIYVGRNIVFLE